MVCKDSVFGYSTIILVSQIAFNVLILLLLFLLQKLIQDAFRQRILQLRLPRAFSRFTFRLSFALIYHCLDNLTIPHRLHRRLALLDRLAQRLGLDLIDPYVLLIFQYSGG